MYDIRQFRPALFALMVLSVSGFSLAAEMPALWILGLVAVLANAWMVFTGRFRPLPRLVSNIITIGALVFVINQVLTSGITPVLMIGEFLMLLQIVKLWEQRGNRDYGQLLVLSLLLMVAAAISTASMLFGIMLAVFVFLSLYCCLLFHLKVETDAAKLAMSAPLHKISPTVLRQDQRYLNRSMRRLTWLVSMVGIVFAVVVFIFFPRGTGAGMFGPTPFKPTQSLVGFTEDVGFQNIARIQQNDDIVATVKLSRNGELVRGTMPLRLRGVTLDLYTGKDGYRWVHWPRESNAAKGTIGSGDEELSVMDMAMNPIFSYEPAPDQPQDLVAEAPPGDRWEQQIRLLPTGTDVVFGMAGDYRITAHKLVSLRYSPRDQTLRNTFHERNPSPTAYDLVSNNDLGHFPPPNRSGTSPREPSSSADDAAISPRIREYALQAQVSGGEGDHSLGSQRYAHYLKEIAANGGAEPGGFYRADDLDEQIARNIERHLQTKFAYTLDLTDVDDYRHEDPLVKFLYTYKKGHCEYFAGAMALMCQSLGMKARLCAGFLCNEYNNTPGANYYIVRQSHAHAWVEVYTAKGWITFDPTSSQDSILQAEHKGWWQDVKHLFDFLEFSYGTTIIGYSPEDRANVIQGAEMALVRSTYGSTSIVGDVRRFFTERLLLSGGFWRVSAGILAIVMALSGIAAMILIMRFAWQHWRLRQRAARIGIDSLPRAEQVRLARQLGFYDDLLHLLDRAHIARKPHQTPLEFGQSLLFLPSDAYEMIGRLTQLFYRVRYGQATLSAGQQQHLARVIEQLRQRLAGGNFA